MNTSLKQDLRAQAHHLKPIILVGAKGLSDALFKETGLALLSHELIKIKVGGTDKLERYNMAEELCQQLHADLIQVIGNTATIYRKNKEKTKLVITTTHSKTKSKTAKSIATRPQESGKAHIRTSARIPRNKDNESKAQRGGQNLKGDGRMNHRIKP